MVVIKEPTEIGERVHALNRDGLSCHYGREPAQQSWLAQIGLSLSHADPLKGFSVDSISSTRVPFYVISHNSVGIWSDSF